ncbi:SDR family oxidoreductase [Ruegeria sp. 2205SS24-7]|uniref:SDR family NAD(P)-dependent oxidoreductase n=1 Tax=Ruegeria discodermiae TaxID=3064389 RepID=UPI002741F510|nr:SDR family oxidoreductase [Ruegeria sp. 2205SS24-7]MDP5219556.1 SDR family oxidoreductase [Ruegeria sp. 2205SS24-7]
MSKTALITGASSGIGRELARYHASLGGDLIITARRGEALDALKAELEAAHEVTVTVIPLDLGAPDEAAKLYEAVKAEAIKVDYLINNAGFGGHGAFLDRDLTDDLNMIRLNVEALVSLCHMFGRDMVASGGGKILNVSSTAAHMPGPLQATYFATKAYVSSFSQALAEELKNKGVTVTALEPGYVVTEFAAVADLEGTQLVAQKGATAEAVAKVGYDAMIDGKLTIINDKSLAFMLGWVMPFLPRGMRLKMVRKMQEK